MVYRRKTLGSRLKPGTILPYGELRNEIFKAAHEGGFADGHRKKRRAPAPKDFRLPLSIWQPVSGFSPPFDNNWEQVWGVITAVQDSIAQELEYLGDDSEACARLNPGRRAMLMAWYVSMEVNNGGFEQYFINSTGNTATFAPESLRHLGDEMVATLVERANSVFAKGPPHDRDDRIREVEKLGEKAQEIWSKLDSEYFGLPDGSKFQFEYMKTHPEEFFRDSV